MAAAKGLSVLLARSFGPFLELRRRLESRAQADSSDAAAQVMAAYMARQAGDGKAMKKYMERAEAADPNLKQVIDKEVPQRRAAYIQAVLDLNHIGGGKGGFWEDRGYEWYAGV